ncbi:pirin family protein [Aequorivita flava]|uniref:Pirin family protein n=1 Tax=Aequorivita flava TaxID=3114371 RepID=A0AB35YSS5_9FLAO
MKTRNIERILTPPRPHMVGDGFRVHQYIPSGLGEGFERMDPFIMMDYNSKFYFPPTDQPRGVGVHPHKGFETVTIAYKGSVAHHDSTGYSGVINEGDVQWMTAASGILHKEYHEENFSKTGGDFQMVQLWVNLPAKYKSSPPKYQGITNAEIKKVELPDDAGFVEVIAGEYAGIKGPASTFTPVHMFNAKLKTAGKASFNFPENYNTVVLVVEGNIKVNNEHEIKTDCLGLFKNDGEKFTIEATNPAVVLVLSGKPLNEPIVAQGPFVMNTRAEIMQAMNDFNMGKFGYLE